MCNSENETGWETTVKLLRRQLLRLAAGAAASPVLAKLASAQTYPSRPIRLMVGFAPGSSPDIIARLVGQALSERIGQPIVIETRPGAGTNIATETVVRAAPDGYTLLLVVATNTINTTLYQNLNFDFIRDIAPIAGVMSVPNVMVVTPSFPVSTVPEFIAYAKANPGKINIANSGNGSTAHLAGELFKMMAGIDMVNVPYHGGADMYAALIGGQVQVLFGLIPSTIQHVRAGQLRALAVTGATRLNVLPDIPAVNEIVPGYEATSWQGLGAPRNTAKEIIERLNAETRAALAEPKMQARLADLGGTILTLSPAEFGQLIADETKKWGEVIRTANIKVE
jgi:tripartite-type tricarboxylate transporter receptor subunit TctC